MTGEAPDIREQEDCPDGDACDWSCDQHKARTPADDAGEVHYPTTPVQCACGWRQTDPDAGSWQDHMSHEARAEVDRLRAEVERLTNNLIASTRAHGRAGAERDSLRVTLAAVGEAIEDMAAVHPLSADRLRATLAADPVSLADVRAALRHGDHGGQPPHAAIDCLADRKSAADPVSLADDPVCVCGESLSTHTSEHNFVEAEHYYGSDHG